MKQNKETRADGLTPDDVFTLEVINAAMKRLKELKIQGEPVIYLWPDGPWTCTLCGHIQPMSKTTCQGCGKEELEEGLRLTGGEDGKA